MYNIMIIDVAHAVDVGFVAALSSAFRFVSQVVGSPGGHHAFAFQVTALALIVQAKTEYLPAIV